MRHEGVARGAGGDHRDLDERTDRLSGGARLGRDRQRGRAAVIDLRHRVGDAVGDTVVLDDAAADRNRLLQSSHRSSQP